MIKQLGVLAVRFHLVIATACTAQGAYLGTAITGKVDLSALAALWLCAWFVYTLDRFVVHPEDQAGAATDLHVLRYARRHRRLFWGLLIAAVLAQGVLGAFTPRLTVGLVWGDLLGSAYILQFPGLPFRLKRVPYFKVVYVPVVAVSTELLLVGQWHLSVAQGAAVVGVLMICVLNTAVCDIKDIDADRTAGIRTLANTWGRADVLRAAQLVAICVALALSGLARMDFHVIATAVTLLVLAAVMGVLRVRAQVPAAFYLVLLDGLIGAPWPLDLLVEYARQQLA